MAPRHRRLSWLAATLFLATAVFACAVRVAETAPPTPPEPDTTILGDPGPLPAPTELAVSEWVANNFAWLYAMWERTEWGGCVEGFQRRDTLFVEGFRLGYVDQAGPSHIDYRCLLDISTIGMVHSHTMVDTIPWRRCMLSPVDHMNRDMQWKAFPQLQVEMLVCAPDTIGFLLRGQTELQLRTIPAVRKPEGE